MAIKLQDAEEKISLVEKQKLELSEDNGDLKTENTFLREASQKLEFDLHELQGEYDKRKIQEENLQFELQNKINEISELENRAASVFGELQYSMVSQLLYEQKYNELRNECLGYIGQNEGLKSQLAAYGPEIASLKECISCLENHTDIQIKFRNPENKEFQGAIFGVIPSAGLLKTYFIPRARVHIARTSMPILLQLRARFRRLERYHLGVL
ncbi:hypothetical protein ACP275_05G091500 [Erythranthe tilingii]